LVDFIFLGTSQRNFSTQKLVEDRGTNCYLTTSSSFFLSKTNNEMTISLMMINSVMILKTS
jgi:hypothetical protein